MNRDEDGKVVNSSYYKQLIGSLIPTELHLSRTKCLLRYLQGSNDFGIFYQKAGNQEPMCFSDSDYAGCYEDRMSTSGYVYLLSGGAVVWSSRKHAIVTLSTTEAEFVAAAACAF
ncbi:hypothetical protein V2J09_018092 [Rumex salicifolius]